MNYSASNRVLRTSATKNALPFGPLGDVVLPAGFDFRVDSFAVSSYSDAIQAPPTNYYGSVLAHGVVDNVQLSLPPPLLTRLTILVPLLVCGTVGFAAVGTLFAAMLMRARTRDVMLPILLYPMTIPVIIAGVRGTSARGVRELSVRQHPAPGEHDDRVGRADPRGDGEHVVEADRQRRERREKEQHQRGDPERPHDPGHLLSLRSS